MPVIPALKMQSQENQKVQGHPQLQGKFKVNLGYVRKNIKIKLTNQKK